MADGSSSQPFQVVSDGHVDGDALSSIKGGETGSKKGLTREEAILGLKIKPA